MEKERLMNKKTNIVNFRNRGTHCTNVCFKLGENVLNKVEKYTYLGVYLDYDNTATILSGIAGRTLGAVIAKTRYLSDFGFKPFEKLFCSGVMPILGYCSDIWGFKNFQSSYSIKERAIRFDLGVHSLLLYQHLGVRLGGVKQEVINGSV